MRSPMISARRILGCGLVALLATGGACVDEEAVEAAKARRDELVASSVPKAELWSEIERRGVAVKKLAEAEAKLSPVNLRSGAIAVEIAALEAKSVSLTERAARQEADRAADRAKAEQELEQAQAEVARLSGIVSGFDARQRGEGPRS